ncbi:uncharacterized protein V6R79_012929 [Siganus canaliculatus]
MSVENAQPKFSISQATEMMKRLFMLTPSDIHSLPSYDDQNFYVAATEGGEYVLKIMNSEDSKNSTLIEVQTYAMNFLSQNGLPTPVALPTTSGHFMSLEEADCGYGSHKYLVRLLTYLPGITISKAPLTPQLLYETGKMAARIDTILQKMDHPHVSVLERDKFLWSLANIPLLEAHIGVFDGDPLQEMVKSVIHQYKTFVAPKYPSFRKCINHGDINDLNVLVQPDETDGYKISGILDFGDMNFGYYIHDLAIAIVYMMMEHPNPVDAGGPVLAAVNPRPTLSFQQATDLSLQLYGIAVTKISSLPSYLDQNFLIMDNEGIKYVLKVINSEESKNEDRIAAQTQVMSFLYQHGFPVHTALPTTNGKVMTMEEIDCGHGLQTYCVRMLTYLPGETIRESPVTTEDIYDVGQLAATVDQTLLQLVCPKRDALMPEDDDLWSLANVPLLEDHLSVMDGDPLQEVVKAVIEQFKSHVMPKFSSFEKGIIHGDLSDQNILVMPENGRHRISGILDFSLLRNHYQVFELAISVMYVMLDYHSPLDVGGALLAGWESVMLLNDEERDSLFLLVLGRLCQSLVFGRENAKNNPENKEYFLITAKNGNRLLAELWEMGKKEVEKKWFSDAKNFQ